MENISLELEKSLDIANSLDQSRHLSATASRLLLKEKDLKRRFQVHREKIFTPSSISIKDSYLHQIANSDVPVPKHHSKSSKKNSKVLKSKTTTKHKQMKQKGEAYNDKMKHKVMKAKTRRNLK